jgi:AAA family ATP:ADP antiporter
MPGTSVFRLMARNGYLVLLALLILVTNWVNTTGEYLLGEFITRAAASAPEVGTPGGPTAGEWIGAFYARFFLVVNVTSLATQLFLVSRLVKYLGVGICLLILPIIALGGYALLIVYPVLTVVRWAKTAENATDYSLQNTVRNMLWLPTTREEKYKAKQFVDTFCWRLGDVLSAAVVFVGTQWLALSLPGFATFNLVLRLLAGDRGADRASIPPTRAGPYSLIDVVSFSASRGRGPPRMPRCDPSIHCHHATCGVAAGCRPGSDRWHVPCELLADRICR